MAVPSAFFSVLGWSQTGSRVDWKCCFGASAGSGGGPGWIQERGRQSVTTGAVGRAAGRAAGQQVGAGARPVQQQ